MERCTKEEGGWEKRVLNVKWEEGIFKSNSKKTQKKKNLKKGNHEETSGKKLVTPHLFKRGLAIE